MSGNERLEQLLERIATALERIATALERDRPSQSFVRQKTEENHEQPTQPESCPRDIEEFLNSRGIKIKTLKAEDSADDVLDSISLFMGNRFSHIKGLLQEIKRTLNTGYSFRMDLRDKKPEEITSITQLCTRLHEIAFLEEYRYNRSPRYTLFGRVNRIPEAINFFTGGWLERYVKSAVIDIVKSLYEEDADFSYVKNPQIVLPDGKDFELDVLFRIKGDIFWFEAKTGDYQRYVSKYSKVAEVMGLDHDHAYMILTDITESGAQALESIFHMKVVRIDDFYESFWDTLKNIG